MKPWIIKLGGSVITDKQSDTPQLNHSVIASLADHIASAHQADDELRLIVLHGAGSFGHPQVQKYDLHHEPLTEDRPFNAGEVLMNMRTLTDTIVSHLRERDVPALPLQTASMFFSNNESLQLANRPLIAQLLQSHAVPVLGGDLVFSAQGTVAAWSADSLAVLLTRQLAAEKIVFATDVNGVYKQWPPQKTEQPVSHLSRADLEELIAKGGTAAGGDVTGGMHGKLSKLLELTNCAVVICDGNDAEALGSALVSEPVGTTIKL